MPASAGFFLALAMSLTLLCNTPFSYASAKGPLDQVKETVNAVIELLNNPELKLEANRDERKRKIIALVEQRFDFHEMSQRALARYWKERSSQEQNDFAALFKKVLENTYIGKVDEYSGEQIFFSKEEVRGNKAVVYSHFVRNNVETPVIYRLTQNSSQWMVYDVIVEGVSLVRNYRTQFESIIEKEKYEGLIAKLEDKANKVDQATDFGEIGISK